MNGHRFPWALLAALMLVMIGPLAVGAIGGILGAMLLVVLWALAVGTFVLFVRGLPRPSGRQPGEPRPPDRD